MKNLNGNKRSEKGLIFAFYFTLLIIGVLTFKINAQNISKDDLAVNITYTDSTPQSGSIDDFDSRSINNAESLSITGNKIAILPNGLFQMSNLEELSIISNTLTEVNPDIRNLYNLRILDLSQTSVKILPDEIHYLKLLKEIRLPYAIWVFRTEEIKKLTNAKIILE